MATPSLADAAQKYVRLLAFQYADKPKARQQVALWTAQALLQGLGWQLQNAFTLGTAAGQQLDWIGKYVGVDRNLVVNTSPFFGFWNSTLFPGSQINKNGLRDSTDAGMSGKNADVIFMDAQTPGSPNTALNDTQYQFVLGLQIVLNSSNGSMASIETFLNQFFPGQISLVDNQDMTLTYSVSSSVSLPLSVLEDFLPKPMGVGITVNIV